MRWPPRLPVLQMLVGEFCMRKRAAVSTVAAAHSTKSRKPLESFLFGFSGPSEGWFPGDLGGRLFKFLREQASY